MYAVIRTGGKQYRVAEDDVLRVEKLKAEPGSTVDFPVLAIGEGEDLQVGAPTVDGATVKGTVVRHGRGKKIVVFKMKRRKGYRRKKGHRQWFTEIRITDLAASGAAAPAPVADETGAPEAEAPEAEAPEPEAPEAEAPETEASEAEASDEESAESAE